MARAWRARGQAYDLVRSAVSARAAGADRLLLAADEGLDAWVARGVDGAWTLQPPARALLHLLGALSGHAQANSEALGRTATATTFRFPQAAARPPVLVVTLDARHSWAGSPDGETPTWDTSLALPDGVYVVESLGPKGQVTSGEVRVEGGILPLTIGPEPVYVRSAR